MKLLNDSVEDINENKIVLKKICEFCGKPLKLSLRNYDRPHKFVFINIAQETPNHYFCSKRCKNDWIFKSSKSKE